MPVPPALPVHTNTPVPVPFSLALCRCSCARRPACVHMPPCPYPVAPPYVRPFGHTPPPGLSANVHLSCLCTHVGLPIPLCPYPLAPMPLCTLPCIVRIPLCPTSIHVPFARALCPVYICLRLFAYVQPPPPLSVSVLDRLLHTLVNTVLQHKGTQPHDNVIVLHGLMRCLTTVPCCATYRPH